MVFTAIGLALCLFSLGVLARRQLAWAGRRRSRTLAEVIRYECTTDEGVAFYAAVYRFTAEGAEHEATDAVYSPRPSVALGDQIWLTYPDGRPELAAVPRPAMWLMVWLAVGAMTAVLAGVALGWLH